MMAVPWAAIFLCSRCPNRERCSRTNAGVRQCFAFDNDFLRVLPSERLMRHRLEYAPVWLIIRAFAVLPRPLARALGISLAHALRLLHRRLWKVGLRNLELAFPEK